MNGVSTIYPLVEVLKQTLLNANLTLSTAESCTGGLLAAACTEIAGSSAFFKGGIVAYANSAKEQCLHISPQVIAEQGAVSPEVGCAMAKNVAGLLAADIGVGITGVAGPDGGTVAKPVGTVWLGISFAGEVRARNLGLSGSRQEIRVQTVEQALKIIIQSVRSGSNQC